MNAIKQYFAILAYRVTSGLMCEVVLRFGFSRATNSRAYQGLDKLLQRIRQYLTAKRNPK